MSGSGIAEALGFRRVMPSRLQEVDTVCRQLRDWCWEGGWVDLAFGFELVVRECLNNAVLHGNRNDPTKHVTVELVHRPPWIRVQITDQGKGFDWRSRLNGSIPDGDKTSGRGLPITTAYARRVRFNSSGNQITLWFQPGPSTNSSHL